MAVTSYAMGQLNPILYFESRGGEIDLPPTTEDALRIQLPMEKRGFILREAKTLPEVDRLQKRLQDREYQTRQTELEHEVNSLAEVRRQIRDKLVSRMVSSSTRDYEREFIQSYLMLREEKRAEYAKRFMGDVCYLTVREFDEKQAKQRVPDILNQLPDRDIPCSICGKFRRVKGGELCFRCSTGE
jgi:hypothetical protein